MGLLRSVSPNLRIKPGVSIWKGNRHRDYVVDRHEVRKVHLRRLNSSVILNVSGCPWSWCFSTLQHGQPIVRIVHTQWCCCLPSNESVNRVHLVEYAGTVLDRSITNPVLRLMQCSAHTAFLFPPQKWPYDGFCGSEMTCSVQLHARNW